MGHMNIGAMPSRKSAPLKGCAPIAGALAMIICVGLVGLLLWAVGISFAVAVGVKTLGWLGVL